MPKIPYTKHPVHGKACIRPFRWGWRVELIDNPSNGPMSYTGKQIAFFAGNARDEALVYANTHNDWQSLGLPGHEVYKGDAIFNKAFKVEPWEHIYLTKDKIYFFVWDTRELTRVAKRPSVDIMPYLHIEKSDNGKPISKNGKWLHLSELEAEPITFKTDKQMHEAATEDDMAVADAANTSLAPDVSNTSGDLFQDADKNNRIRYVNDKCQVYWYLPAAQALFNEDMSYCMMHGSVKDCIQKFNLRKDMKANESYDECKEKRPLDLKDTLVRARCTIETLGERANDWHQLGLDFTNDEKRGWIRFVVKPDKEYCIRLCNVLAELGYDGFKIATLWPALAIQAGLMQYQQIETLKQGNHIVKNSGEIVVLEDCNY